MVKLNGDIEIMGEKDEAICLFVCFQTFWNISNFLPSNINPNQQFEMSANTVETAKFNLLIIIVIIVYLYSETSNTNNVHY